MALALPAPPIADPRDRPDSAYASLGHAPPVPVALALTAGIIADRALGVPASAAAGLLVIGLAGWFAGTRRSTSAGLMGLWLAIAAVGALHHQQYRDRYDADD